MSRIQIRQKTKTAVLGLAIVLGILATAGRGDLMKAGGGMSDPISQQHAASATAAGADQPQIGVHPVVLRVIELRVARPCSDRGRTT